MNSQQLSDLEKQVNTIIANAQEARAELSSYQTGAKALEQVSQSLEILAAEQQSLTRQLKDSTVKLNDTDTMKLSQRINELDVEVKSIQHDVTEIKTSLAWITQYLNSGVILRKRRGLFRRQ